MYTLGHNFHLIMPLFAGIGAFLSTFHQGSLGGMYGVLFGRPYILRDGFFIWPWTFFLYILSAVPPEIELVYENAGTGIS